MVPAEKSEWMVSRRGKDGARGPDFSWVTQPSEKIKVKPLVRFLECDGQVGHRIKCGQGWVIRIVEVGSSANLSKLDIWRELSITSSNDTKVMKNGAVELRIVFIFKVNKE